MSKKPEIIPGLGTGGVPSWNIHHGEVPNAEAELAMRIAERWALVAAVPDGEDSAGRQKLRLPSPNELAGRSCAIAEVLFVHFRERGWIIDIPSSAEAAVAFEARLKDELKR